MEEKDNEEEEDEARFHDYDDNPRDSHGLNEKALGKQPARDEDEGMASQADRDMGPEQGHPQEAQIPPMQRLSQKDKQKVAELAEKMFNVASEQQKARTLLQLQSRIHPTQWQEMISQGRDPLMWFYQNQAYHVLKANTNRIKQQQSLDTTADTE
ncbi:hypothetical protein ACHAPY_004441 [Fusarium culmorum]